MFLEPDTAGGGFAGHGRLPGPFTSPALGAGVGSTVSVGGEARLERLARCF